MKDFVLFVGRIVSARSEWEVKKKQVNDVLLVYGLESPDRPDVTEIG